MNNKDRERFTEEVNPIRDVIVDKVVARSKVWIRIRY